MLIITREKFTWRFISYVCSSCFCCKVIARARSNKPKTRERSLKAELISRLFSMKSGQADRRSKDICDCLLSIVIHIAKISLLFINAKVMRYAMSD